MIAISAEPTTEARHNPRRPRRISNYQPAALARCIPDCMTSHGQNTHWHFVLVSACANRHRRTDCQSAPQRAAHMIAISTEPTTEARHNPRRPPRISHYQPAAPVLVLHFLGVPEIGVGEKGETPDNDQIIEFSPAEDGASP